MGNIRHSQHSAAKMFCSVSLLGRKTNSVLIFARENEILQLVVRDNTFCVRILPIPANLRANIFSLQNNVVHEPNCGLA